MSNSSTALASNATLSSPSNSTLPFNNATALHASSLLCHTTFIPVGVFGFYFLFTLQLLIISSLISTLQPFLNSRWPSRPRFCCGGRRKPDISDKPMVVKTKGIFTLLGDAILLTYSLFMLAQHGRVVWGCREYTLWIHYVVVVLLASVCTTIASLLSFITFLPFRLAATEFYEKIKEDGEEQKLRPNWIRRTEILLLVSALILHIGVGVYFLIRRTVLSMISDGMGVYLEGMSKRATAASLVPSILLIAVAIWIIVACGVYGKVESVQDELIEALGRAGRVAVVLPVLMVLYGIILCFVGPSYVLMGKIVEDPWGKVFLETVVGKIDAVMTAIFPALHGLAMML
ncbi:hypothetical protein BJ508DRAFT_76547 [Ascobolus immersus RN42]|uniref:Uncharacterized protein n=1 Tax=Ascobolus immersus RN42 TaxID=1160509 RepID=A0A3N4HRG8_ASCIM|nr:hypothetical protein BJ508DRAFT_76547 [Ascobolus immersus RN42]